MQRSIENVSFTPENQTVVNATQNKQEVRGTFMLPAVLLTALVGLGLSASFILNEDKGADLNTGDAPMAVSVPEPVTTEEYEVTVSTPETPANQIIETPEAVANPEAPTPDTTATPGQ